jgi:ribosomal protein S18 acetylase RimI-like enzyme
MASPAVAPSFVLDARRIEEAGLNAVQTPRQLFHDGWLLRLSPGKAKRGRSVNAWFGSTLPVAAKIAHCERVYAANDLPPLFRITPFDHPADLDAVLAARGYLSFDDTLVQALVLPAAPFAPAPPAGLAVEPTAVDGFVAAIGALRHSPGAQVEAHRERLLHLPLPARRVVVRAGSEVVCVAQTALDGEYAGLFDVVTADAARGRGYATFACALLLDWAREQGARAAYLQVDAANAPAIAVYRKFGFATAYRYHYRGRPGACR